MDFNSVKGRRLTRPIAMLLCILFVLSSCVFGNFLFNINAKAAVNNYMYYTADYANAADAQKAAKAINKQIAEEGFTLMENKDNMLPLKPKSGNDKINISIFGKNSASLIRAGFGSSDNISTRTELYDVFDKAENFNVNPILKEFYKNDNKSGPTSRYGLDHDLSIDNVRAGLKTFETPYTMYTAAGVPSSYKSYNDAAIVFLSRFAGEGSDVPMTSLKNWDSYEDSNKLDSARKWDDHYLQLDANEVKMLQEVMNNFSNITIMLNTAGPVELGFMNDPTHYLYSDNNYTTTPEAAKEKMAKMKGAMFIGYMGTNGAEAIPGLLDGTVSPSGHLTDTWVSNMKNDPVWQNFGLNARVDGGEYGEDFVQYDEDIYIGYRYYETRYKTEGANGEAWYNGDATQPKQVVYPFGHGLSYTSFEWNDITSVNSTGGSNLTEKSEITTKVTVKNTGKVAGKEVVQLYYNAPYYVGGISKSHIVLGGFAKTKLLAPNEEQELTIVIKADEMDSYDWSDANKNGFKGYELEHGDYNIVLAKDSHDAAKLNEDFTTKYTVEGNITLATDSKTGAPVGNLFDSVSGTGKTNDPESFKGVRKYFSRDDFAGTFPMSALLKKNGMKQERAKYTINEAFDEGKPWYSDVMPTQAQVPGTSETNKVKLWHLRGRDYNDPLWDKLLDQLTVQELAVQIGDGYGFRGTKAIDSIDMPSVLDDDGPLGRRQSPGDIQWVSNPITAQTFNEELANKQGIAFGNAMLLDSKFGRGGTYGVGLNTHRSPFGGRNFEYFSEDGFLGGKIGGNVIAGSLSKGCYQVIKHAFLNDQETERGTVQTWASEQAMREIYGKSFEIAVKEFGCNAMMSGVNFIGDKTCAANWEFLTGLLRDEWGFEGYVITDMATQYTDMCIRAGNDSMMAYPNPNPPKLDVQSLTATQLTNMRKSVKNILFTRANTSGVNGFGGAPLDILSYGGANTIYGVENVDNAITVANVTNRYYDQSNITYQMAEGSKLPSGMTLSDAGILSGAPTEDGTYTFTIVANESVSEKVVYPFKDVAKTFKLEVYSKNNIPSKIIFKDDNLGIIPHGFEFSKSIKSAVVFDSNGLLSTDVTYALASGNELPDGLKLVDGVITGVTTAEPGSYFFTIVASSPGKESTELDFIVKIKAYNIDFPPVEVPSLTVGKKALIEAGSGTSLDNIQITYALKLGSKLPEGLELNGNTGVISGIPTRAHNDYTFTIVASGKNASPKEVTYNVDVIGMVFEDITFDNILIGKEYSFKLGAGANDGNSPDIFYQLKAGSTMPKGFILLADGTIIGNGIDYGAMSFTVQAVAEGYIVAESTVTIDLYDIFADEPTGEDGSAIDEKTISCGSITNGSVSVGTFLVILSVGSLLAFTLIRKKSSTNK